MTKYAPGNYTLTLFDKIGTKLSSKSLENSGFVVAKAFGEATVSSGEASSFTISRVLYNSAVPARENYDIRCNKS